MRSVISLLIVHFIMATPLNSLLVRESTETVDERNILVALTEDQRISFRLKGMKSGVVSIPIKQLYEQLTNTPGAKPKAEPKLTGDLSEYLINRLRTKNATTPGRMELVSRIDELCVELLNEQKEKS